MEYWFEIFQYEYVYRGLAASAIVGIMCGVLGCFIFLRNMALIGDALSHSILPGVVVGFMIAGHSVLAFFVGSVIAGLISAFLITWIQQNVKSKEDAAIGLVFTAMFSIGIIGISWLTKQEGVHLDMKDFLFGNVLGISNQDLWLTGLIGMYVLLCITVFFRYFFLTTFDQILAQTMGISVAAVHYFLMLLLSFAVVASLQSVGVILVVGMLIIPSSTAFLLTNRLKQMIFFSAALGLLATTLGFLLAVVLETTPGPLMTLVAVSGYILAILFAPGKGVISKIWNRKQSQRKIAKDDLLKLIAQLHEKGNLTRSILQRSYPGRKLISLCHELKKDGLLAYDKAADDWSITAEGINRAYELIRAHRVWESFMVENLGVSKEEVHLQAEKLEHFLSPGLVDEIQASISSPVIDPHGSVIPQSKMQGEVKPMHELRIGQKALVVMGQKEESVVASLWKMGITPNTLLTITAIEKDAMRVLLDAISIEIPLDIARKTLVLEVSGG